MDYVAKLIKLGFVPCCAEKIVNDYKEAGKISDLESYISIKEHVSEVLG